MDQKQTKAIQLEANMIRELAVKLDDCASNLKEQQTIEVQQWVKSARFYLYEAMEQMESAANLLENHLNNRMAG